jgi:hypothetical protein
VQLQNKGNPDDFSVISTFIIVILSPNSSKIEATTPSFSITLVVQVE